MNQNVWDTTDTQIPIRCFRFLPPADENFCLQATDPSCHWGASLSQTGKKPFTLTFTSTARVILSVWTVRGNQNARWDYIKSMPLSMFNSKSVLLWADNTNLCTTVLPLSLSYRKLAHESWESDFHVQIKINSKTSKI